MKLSSKPTGITLAFGLGLSTILGATPAMAAPAPAVAASAMTTPTIFKIHSKASCDRQMSAGARAYSRLRPMQVAAVCHAANMTRYAGCLAGAK